MKTYFTKTFKKHYLKRIKPHPNLDLLFAERRNLFVDNSNNPILEDHSLTGKMKGYRAFSITGDIRVVYYVHDNIAYFADIGTHNQVY